MGSLVNWARQQGKWDFISRNKQIVLITCLEDSTNEVEPHERHFFLLHHVHFSLKIKNSKQKVHFLNFPDPGAFRQPAAEVLPASFP